MIEKMAFGDPIGAGISLDGPDPGSGKCANYCLNYSCGWAWWLDDDVRANKANTRAHLP